MKRTPEVIDAWFDSGSMPFAQWHYPFEGEATFAQQFPADFICEGIDQTRGWFYSLLAISTVLFDRPPYKNVVVNDLVLDSEGVKMSKSRGNVVDPWEAISEFGADAVRYYLLAVSSPWLPKRHDPKAIGEVRRKFFGTLQATYRFFELYANIEGWKPERLMPLEQRPMLDRWLISRLDGLIEACRVDLDAYNVTPAIRRIAAFVIDDMSNWYVRRSRARFWGTRAATRDTMDAAFSTLWETLATVCRLLAPMTPFVTDWMHRELADGSSVHLERYPEPQGRRDSDLEDAMDLARQLSGLGRAARDAAGTKVRQPLRRMLAVAPAGRVARMTTEMLEIVRDELNVRKIAFVGDAAEVVSYRAEPNFAHLGPEFGSRAGAVAEALRGLDGASLATWRSQGGELAVEVNGERTVVPEVGFALVEVPREGLVVQSEGGILVGLDTVLDDELRKEGVARELVNRIQRLRKDSGLELDDRIRLGIFGAPEVASAAEAHRDYIAGEVLAVEVEVGPQPPKGDGYEHTREIRLDGCEAVIAVQVR
jgi:isoleucyl-tRNA synthetase